MESPQTRIVRDREGWHASTEIELEASRIVKITTHRAHGTDKLVTRAIVSRMDGGFLTHAVGYGTASGDFSRNVRVATVPRVTERLVRKQHAEALIQIEAIKQAIDAHYVLQRQTQLAETREPA